MYSDHCPNFLLTALTLYTEWHPSLIFHCFKFTNISTHSIKLTSPDGSLGVKKKHVHMGLPRSQFVVTSKKQQLQVCCTTNFNLTSFDTIYLTERNMFTGIQLKHSLFYSEVATSITRACNKGFQDPAVEHCEKV